MKNRPKLQTAIKALLLVGMGLFLYSRLSNGTLFFYINERFAGLTLLAVIGLLLVGISYQFGDDEGHGHSHHGHEHGYDDHDHDHNLTWIGVAIMLAPILMGVLVTPRPLGAAAMANREVGFESRSAMPAAVAAAAEKSSTERNILDWLYAFQRDGEDAFDGETVDVTGFVFKGEDFGTDEFSLTRYIVSCCAADASYVSMVVRGDGAEPLESDEWVRVQGQLEMSTFNGEPRIVVVPTSIESVPIPQQPYLYP